jgi:RHS repeat-associated protein
MLTARTNPFRAVSIDARDAAGRILQQTTAAGAAATMVETMSWRADSTLDTYTVTRTGAGAWNEARAYTYNSRGQLVSEGFAPAPAASASLAYLFDGNNPGLGVRTDAKVGTGAPLSWESRAAAVNALGRVTQDQVNAAGRAVPANGVALGADHVDVLVDGIAQGRARHPGWADPAGAWSIDLSLPPGSHTLTANAVHPSGQYTVTASSTFSVTGTAGSPGNVTSAYDADGNVTSRTWDTGLVQTLSWDAFGRLIKVAQRDVSNNGFDWAAVYDGLGRRLKTTQQPVTANLPNGSSTVTTSIYDPQVEFLEIGVAVNGVKAWKVFGPDLNGRFGGLQGTGGLEAIILDATGTTTGVINDQFGNGVAAVSGGTVTWNLTRVGAYGPLPGIQAQTLTDVSQLAAATAWRSHRIDPTGFYWLGARYYEPTSGRFLSADPAGHAVSPSLYDVSVRSGTSYS